MSIVDEWTDSGLTSAQRYRRRHPERCLVAQKKWRDKNLPKQRQLQRAYNHRDPIRRLLISLKTRAKKEGVPFDLVKEDIGIPEFCPILGVKLIPYGKDLKARTNNSATIDRIIPSRGYVRGNIQVISFRANRIKNNATLDELKAIIAYMENWKAGW